MTATLSKLGFIVYSIVDASAAQVNECIGIATTERGDATSILFYYSGHGIQVAGENYLLGVGAGNDDYGSRDRLVLSEVINNLRSSFATVLLFLDACRTNPYGVDALQGLSPEPARGAVPLVETQPKPFGSVQPKGVYIAYSTSPNAVALDGQGKLSPFTEAFVKSIVRPGYSVQRVMGEINRLVGEATNWSQTPWSLSSLNVEVKFAGELTASEMADRSKLYAARSLESLKAGDRRQAIIEALKGVPFGTIHPSEAEFKQAATALQRALASSAIRIRSEGNVARVVTNHDLSRAATVRDSGNASMVLELWDTSTGNLIKQLTEVGGDQSFRLSMTSPDFSDDGLRIASLNGNSGVTVWSAMDGREIVSIKDPIFEAGRKPAFGESYLSKVDLNADGSMLLASGGRDDAFVLWNVAKGEVSFPQPKVELAEWIQNSGLVPGFSPDGFSGEYNQTLVAVFLENKDRIGFWGNCGCGVKFLAGVVDINHQKLLYLTTSNEDFHFYIGEDEYNILSPSKRQVLFNAFDNINSRQSLKLLDLQGETIKTILTKVDNSAAYGFSPSSEFVVDVTGQHIDFFDATLGVPVVGPSLEVEDPFIPSGGVFTFQGQLLGVDTRKRVSDIFHERPALPSAIEQALGLLSPAEATDVLMERARYWNFE